MMSEETTNLVAKWWRNKVEHVLNNSINEAKAAAHESVTSAVALICFFEDALNKLDVFEKSLINFIKSNNMEECTIYFSSKRICCMLAEAARIAKIPDNIIRMPDTITIVANDEFSLVKLPCINDSSIIKITSADEIDDSLDWA